MVVAEEEILCSKTHEYVLKKDDYYLIGLTDHLINKMGEIVFLELPEIGTSFVKNEIFGTLQGINSSLDLYMPIGGTIIEINENIVDNYDNLKDFSWLIKIESSTALEDSVDLYDYEDYLELA